MNEALLVVNNGAHHERVGVRFGDMSRDVDNITWHLCMLIHQQTQAPSVGNTISYYSHHSRRSTLWHEGLGQGGDWHFVQF
jgi:hypothetical protein